MGAEQNTMQRLTVFVHTGKCVIVKKEKKKGAGGGDESPKCYPAVEMSPASPRRVGGFKARDDGRELDTELPVCAGRLLLFVLQSLISCAFYICSPFSKHLEAQQQQQQQEVVHQKQQSEASAHGEHMQRCRASV